MKPKLYTYDAPIWSCHLQEETGEYLLRGDYPVVLTLDKDKKPNYVYVSSEELNGYIFDLKDKSWTKNGAATNKPVVTPIEKYLFSEKVLSRFDGGGCESLKEYLSYLQGDLEAKLQANRDAANDKSERLTTETYGVLPRFSRVKVASITEQIKDYAAELRSFAATIHGVTTSTLRSKASDLHAAARKAGDLEQQFELIPGTSIPVLTAEQKLEYVKQAAKKYEHNEAYFIQEPPHMDEFTDNTNIVRRLKEHCADMPTIEFTYVRRRHKIVYASTGYFRNTPEALNSIVNADGVTEQGPTTIIYKNGVWKTVSKDEGRGKGTQPIIYCGPSWVVKFIFRDREGKVADILTDNEVHVITGAEWAEAVRPWRPDLLEKWVPEPNEIYMLCSHWCQRNAAYAYQEGYIDLYSLACMRLTLNQWIRAFAYPRTGRSFNIEGITEYATVNGYTDRRKMALIQEFLQRKEAAGAVAAEAAPKQAADMPF